MEQSSNFTIVDFYADIGAVEIFIHELNQTLTVEVPIENDQYITGAVLYNYLEGVVPHSSILRRRQLQTVRNASALEQYINHTKRQETKAAAIRAIRHRALLECDWVMTSDAGFTPKQMEVFREYRQALRDVPQQAGFPDNVVWPECDGEWINHPEIKKAHELDN